MTQENYNVEFTLDLFENGGIIKIPYNEKTKKIALFDGILINDQFYRILAYSSTMRRNGTESIHLAASTQKEFKEIAESESTFLVHDLDEILKE